VQRNVVARSPNRCCHGNSTVTNLCIVYDLHVAAKNIISLSAVTKMQECVPIALLSTNKIFRTAVNSLNVHSSSCQFLDIFV
jgi:hypothetical protein